SKKSLLFMAESGRRRRSVGTHALFVVVDLLHHSPTTLAGKRKLHFVGNGEPRLIALLCRKPLHVSLVIRTVVFVVAEQITFSMLELTQKNREVPHMIFAEQITNPRIGVGVQSLISGNAFGFNSNHHPNSANRVLTPLESK